MIIYKFPFWCIQLATERKLLEVEINHRTSIIQVQSSFYTCNQEYFKSISWCNVYGTGTFYYAFSTPLVLFLAVYYKCHISSYETDDMEC
jgi:hypothetical protein